MRGSSKKRRSSQRQHSATDGSAENIIVRLSTSKRVQLLMVPGSCDHVHLSLKDAFGGHLW